MTRNHTGHRVGECHQRAKLSDAQVRAIRSEYLAYVRGYKQLGAKYGAPWPTVRDVVTYRTRGSA